MVRILLSRFRSLSIFGDVCFFNNDFAVKDLGGFTMRNRGSGKFCLLVCALLLFFCENIYAAEYFVDASKGNDNNPGTFAMPWKSINKANATLKPGDTVFLRSGTHVQTIAPANSGGHGAYITYRNYPQDPKWSAIVTTSGVGFNIDAKNYIRIEGIFFNRTGHHWGIIQNSSKYAIIQNCRFYDSGTYQGIRIADAGSEFTRISNNHFPDAALARTFQTWDSSCQQAWDSGGSLPDHCNRETGPADFIRVMSGGNVISHNYFGNSSHSNIADFSRSERGNVYRDNTFANQFHRGFEKVYTNGKAIVENNTILDSGKQKHRNPSYRDRVQRNGAGIKVYSSNSIVRKNIVRDCNIGLLVGGTTNQISNRSRFYNNTFYNNSLQVFQTGNSSVDYNHNVFQNNIIYNDANGRSVKKVTGFEKTDQDWIFWYNVADLDQGSNTHNLFINNSFNAVHNSFYFKSNRSTAKSLLQVMQQYPGEWASNNAYRSPLFQNYKDLTLDGSCKLIDAGAWLSKITSPSAKTRNTIVLTDASFFFDGWGIPGEKGDEIKTQSGATSIIQSINYSTNTITVSPAIDIYNGEGIGLSYSGKAPDLGAKQFGGTITILPVRNLRIATPAN
jgi:hypothetical protein